MKFFIYGGLILLSLVLQSTVFALLPFLKASPDLIVVLVCLFSLLNGPVFGAKFGFVAGLALDLLVGEMIGLNAITKGVIGISVGFLCKRFYKENYFIPFITVMLATVFDQFLYLLGMLVFGLHVPWMVAINQVILPLSIYNGIISILIYLRIYELNKGISS